MLSKINGIYVELKEELLKKNPLIFRLVFQKLYEKKNH